MNVYKDRDMNNAEIATLVKEAKNQKLEALSKLSTYFYPKIYRHLLYKVNNREDAEDLTSEVFVRMVKSLKKQRGSFNAWLYRIASNLAVDYYRKKARQKEVSLVEDYNEHIEDKEDVAESILQHQTLNKAMSTLPDEQRQTIVLKFLEGYTNKEIAEILSKSIGAVKALQFRALNNLKNILQSEG